MPRGRPVVPLALSEETHNELETLSRSRSLPHALVRRAQIILMAAEGMSHEDIGRRVGLSRAMVGIWRNLIKKIDLFVSNYNPKSKPFVWTANADSILWNNKS